MDIFIRPVLESLLDDEEWIEDFDEDALAFEQGFETTALEVEPGQVFEIPEGCEGMLPEEIVDEAGDESSILHSGTYLLSEDGKSIEPVGGRGT